VLPFGVFFTVIKKNTVGDNKFFLDRIICLSVPLNVKFAVISIFLVCAMRNSLINNFKYFIYKSGFSFIYYSANYLFFKTGFLDQFYISKSEGNIF